MPGTETLGGAPTLAQGRPHVQGGCTPDTKTPLTLGARAGGSGVVAASANGLHRGLDVQPLQSRAGHGRAPRPYALSLAWGESLWPGEAPLVFLETD